jgi:hypothetical protein
MGLSEATGGIRWVAEPLGRGPRQLLEPRVPLAPDLGHDPGLPAGLPGYSE